MTTRRRVGLPYQLLVGLAIAVLLLTMTVGAAGAHEPGASAIAVTTLDSGVSVDMWLPLDRLEIATDLALTDVGASLVTDYSEALTDYITNHMMIVGADDAAWDDATVDALSVDAIEGVDNLIVAASFAAPGGVVTDFSFVYDVIIEHLRTHVATLVVSSGEGGSVLAGTFDHATTSVDVDVDAVNVAFGRIVRFGFDHVVDGLDHLLFLVVILLPAPLAIGSARRWSTPTSLRGALLRVTKIASAFTLGHTLTLGAATAGWIEAPARLVEALIAVSIGVGAVHAIRPLYRRSEAILAGAFGLVHGLAFATILQHLELTETSMLQSLVAFNVGVELAQLAVIALVIPSFLLLSRTTWYPRIRVFGAGLASVAAVGWLVERVGVASNPLSGLEEAATANLLIIAALLGAIALMARSTGARAPAPSPRPLRTCS